MTVMIRDVLQRPAGEHHLPRACSVWTKLQLFPVACPENKRGQNLLRLRRCLCIALSISSFFRHHSNSRALLCACSKRSKSPLLPSPHCLFINDQIVQFTDTEFQNFSLPCIYFLIPPRTWWHIVLLSNFPRHLTVVEQTKVVCTTKWSFFCWLTWVVIQLLLCDWYFPKF